MPATICVPVGIIPDMKRLRTLKSDVLVADAGPSGGCPAIEIEFAEPSLCTLTNQKQMKGNSVNCDHMHLMELE
jgi:hypothetical protein